MKCITIGNSMLYNLCKKIWTTRETIGRLMTKLDDWRVCGICSLRDGETLKLRDYL